jgi:hypothetical protein
LDQLSKDDAIALARAVGLATTGRTTKAQAVSMIRNTVLDRRKDLIGAAY